ncbi:MAG: glycerophosphodiester phosphodiesterase family protein [Bacteroidota bacterium]
METHTNNDANDAKAQTIKKPIDWQGHRGARGILPENTIPAFIKALEYVTTLELDLAVSQDGRTIVSHEPWMSSHICQPPDGRNVEEAEQMELLIYKMDYETIKQYDCGSRGNERFEEQQKMATYKPSLMDMVSNVELHCEKNSQTRPHYNIELKSQEEWYDSLCPAPQRFVQLVLEEIKLLDINDRVNLQSFDINILQEIRKQDKEMPIAYLIENLDSLDKNLEKLGFIPEIYSPYYMLLNKELIQQIHDKGMQLIPWTVNDPEVMKRLVAEGVDGIITDYPNLIPAEVK